MDDKEPKRRRWSARTLYRELARFIEAHDLDLGLTIDDLMESLKVEIVEEAIR